MSPKGPKGRRSAEATARAEAAARRFTEQSLRAAVTGFQLLQERWGRLTVAQIRRVSGLLADHADVLYRLADRVERGAAAPRLPKKYGLHVLADRVSRAGRGDDPVTREVLARLAELAEVGDRTPPTTPRALRALAIEVMILVERVEGARAFPSRQPPPRRGRRPNILLAQLIDRTTRLGVADIEVARALARAGVEPIGPGSDETDLAERWAAIIKSARARRRR